MKITNVINYISDKTHYLKIETDEGVYGYGECSPMDNYLICQIIQKRLKHQIIGMDPFDTELIQETLLKKNYKISGQMLAIALSGIDIALWDIKARYLNVPVYNLLGGRLKEEIEFYGSSLSRHLSIQDECRKIKGCIDEFGFQAVKIKVGARLGNSMTVPDIDSDVEKVRAVRETIGDKCKLLVDGNGSYMYFQAIQLYNKIKRYDIYQYEEPCPYYDLEAYIKLGKKIDIPINVGEQDWNLHTFRDFISRGAVQICAADVTKCGGFTNLKKVAALCRAYGIILGPHNTSRGIGLAATLHMAASTPECNYYMEYCIEDSKDEMESLMDTKFIPINGKIKVPSGAGLGVQLDQDRMERDMEIICRD